MSAARSYTVKVSLRAKNVRLCLSMRDGLVVVVPRGFDRGRIPALLEKKKRWLDRACARIEAQRRIVEAEPPDVVPRRMALQGIGEEWSIEYRSNGHPGMRAVERPGNRLHVLGDTGDVEACRTAVRRWLNRKARAHFEPRLRALSQEHGFRIARVSVRSQRTRWGSCSRQGTVSLNLKLLFVPPELVRHVMLHELCHTVHMDHSRAFRALLTRYEPDSREMEKAVRNAGLFVPPWLEAPEWRPPGP